MELRFGGAPRCGAIDMVAVCYGRGVRRPRVFVFGCRLGVAVCISVGKFAVLDRLQARCEELRTLVALDLACTCAAGSIRADVTAR